MLVPEQRQGNWRGFVILTAINHSPTLNWLTRTFLPALSLSRLEKQMVAILPLHLQRCITNYMGCVLLRVCGEKPGLLSFQILQESARIQITLSVKGKKYQFFAAVWQMRERNGYLGQHSDLPPWAVPLRVLLPQKF